MVCKEIVDFIADDRQLFVDLIAEFHAEVCRSIVLAVFVYMKVVHSYILA
jgi:hypothetical protein